MVYRSRLRGERPKAFWGALVGGAMNLIGSAISSKAQARAIQKQIEAQQEAARTQLELTNQSNLASTLNSYASATRSYSDEDKAGLQYRLGGNKKLGSDRIVITDGGRAKKIAPNTFLLQGGSHEDTNESGNTGIGINVGGNEIEAEGGEVAQKKGNSLRIFSAQPMLGEISPAQAVLRGANKDKVFNAQQKFKSRNYLNDNKEIYKNGGVKGPTYNKQTKRWYNAQNKMLRVGHGYYSQGINKFVQYNTDGTVSKFSPLDWYNKTLQGEHHTQSMRIGNKSISLKHAITIGKGATYSPFRQYKVQLKNNKNRGFTEESEDLTNDEINIVGGKNNISKLNTKFAIPYGKGIVINGKEISKNLLDSIAYNAGLNKYPINKLNYAYGLPAQESHNGRIASGSIMNKNEKYDTKAFNNAVANMNLFKNFGVIPANVVIRNWTNKNDVGVDKRTSYNLSNNLSPLYQGFDLFRRGLYNTGDKNHTIDVKNAGNLIINTPEFKRYWNDSGKQQYVRGYNDTNKAASYERMINSNKQYSKYINHYPNKRLFNFGGRIKFAGGGWTAPIYNTKHYRVSNRMRKQIAAWEGSDFAGQNRKFKGDAIGAKERELRQMMGKTYNYLNDNQRDSLNSIYYNSRIDTFKNAFGKWFKNLNNAVAAGDERAFNNSLAGIRQSMTVGANRKGMSGLAKRRAWEQNWFGNPVPLDSQETKEALAREAANRMIIPADNTRVVYQPEYIEVPAPVGHGIVPVDNPDPNLLQGNIKENVINMGNKFRVNQRCGGSTRARLRCGGSIRPVKGSRMKLAFGDVVYPYRRNNNFDYWDEIAQEQNNNDKGGIAPWQESNVYDVKVPNKITSSTPVIPYTPSQVVLNNNTDNTTNATIPYSGNKSGMILRDADWYGLGADLVSSIGGNLIGLGAYNKLNFDYSLPNFVEETPVALNTTYHNEAQKSNVERNRLNSRNSILRNTMSGSTAVGRMQGVDTNALYQLNQLADEKTNKETELMNQNLLNEQQVRARNAAAKNQYYATVANIKNAALQAKNEAELAKGQLLSGTLQGIGNSFQNLINQGRQNYDDTQAMLMGVAASDYATPSRLLELGVDVGDDSALAGIYRSAMNIPNPGAKPKREDYSDNTEYSYALTRWENQNKAYQRRNSYANLIKGRMSRKNQIKYGII